MTLNAKIKASIDTQFDTWEAQLKNKSMPLEDIFDIIGTEFINTVKNDTEEISQYRLDKLKSLEDLAMTLEEDSVEIEENENEADEREAQGMDESPEADDDEDN